MNIVIPLHFEVAIPVWGVLLLLAGHFIGDFIMQTDEMAKGKSTSNWVLLNHVLMYGIGIGVSGWMLFMFTDIFVRIPGHLPRLQPFLWLTWLIVNMVLHFVTDYFTSRWTSKLYQADRRHDFFTVIGFDQFLHASALLLTTAWVLS